MNSIIDQLGEYGRVLTAFVGDKNITVMGSEHEGGDKGIHDRDVSMLEESKGELLKSFTLLNTVTENHLNNTPCAGQMCILIALSR